MKISLKKKNTVTFLMVYKIRPLFEKIYMNIKFNKNDL